MSMLYYAHHSKKCASYAQPFDDNADNAYYNGHYNEYVGLFV